MTWLESEFNYRPPASAESKTIKGKKADKPKTTAKTTTLKTKESDKKEDKTA